MLSTRPAARPMANANLRQHLSRIQLVKTRGNDLLPKWTLHGWILRRTTGRLQQKLKKKLRNKTIKRVFNGH